jgi:hypothetical protein
MAKLSKTMSILKFTPGLLNACLFWYTYKQWKNQSKYKKLKGKGSMVFGRGQKLTVAERFWQTDEPMVEKSSRFS